MVDVENFMHPRLIRMVSYLLTGIFFVSHATPAVAGLVSTDTLLNAQSIQQQRATLHAALAREEALGILARYGLTTEQARERIDKLTDREVRQIASQIDNLPAGGNVALILLIIVLVVLLLEAVGFIDIFPFM